MKRFRKSESVLSGIADWFIMNILFVIVVSVLSACSSQPQEPTEIVLFEGKEQCGKDTDQVVALYRQVCEDSAQEDLMHDLIRCFGENGYAAVDSENQIDMTNPEQVLAFCRAVDAEEEAALSIIEVMCTEVITPAGIVRTAGGFRQYDFQTKDGSVNVARGYYRFDTDGNLLHEDTVYYPAEQWQYTEEGYLIFAGRYFADDYYIISLADEPEHAALRVAPLDAQCRELCRKYIQPVGYEDNDLFLANWSEGDSTSLANLDFYDLFDKFYPMCYQKQNPYTACENPGVGFVYRVAESEFESVIGTCLNVDPGVLRSNTVYFAEDRSYEYKPRGLYEAGCSNVPCPEVVKCSENADGTITLTVNAVFAYEGTAKAFAHEVVIRKLQDGGFQYVSNKITEGGCDAWWHTERLTAQEWDEVYAGHASEETSAVRDGSDADDTLWYLPQADSCLLTDAERDELQDTVLTAAGHASGVYRNVEIEEGPSYASDVRDFGPAQCREVTELLGKAGFVSISENMNMQNHERFEAFYDAYEQKQDAMVTVYDVMQDGLIGALTFVYRNGDTGGGIQTYYIGIGWQEGGQPRIKNILISDVAKMHMTEKGYFIYRYTDQIVHSDENQFLRVSPMPEKCRELTEKYVDGLSFVNYNAFATDWDSSNVEEILMPCMFEDIYRIDTGVYLRAENDQIPSELYERIMMTYFPVSREQIRSKCGYDADSDSYPYEMIFATPHAPFGEVVDYSISDAGMITLSVEGVWIDYDTDCAFTSKIVVQPFADGTFRYLSNEISSEVDAFAQYFMDSDG